MIQINHFGDCVTGTPGTGTMPCDLKSFKDMRGHNLHPKGFFKTLATDTITEASWRNDIKAFNVIPVMGIYNFRQNTPENTLATSNTGKKAKVRNGLPDYSYDFTKGGCFQKALYELSGDDRWDVSFVFNDGVLLYINTSKTQISGFDMGLYDVETFKFQTESDPEMSTVNMQLNDAEGINKNWAFLTWEKLGFNMTKVRGVVETSITYTQQPTAGATTFAVKVTSGCNSANPILGLDESASWLLGGTQATSRTVSTVVYRPATQDYLITMSGAVAAGDTIQPTLISEAAEYFVAEDAAGGLYKGKAPLATVA